MSLAFASLALNSSLFAFDHNLGFPFLCIPPFWLFLIFWHNNLGFSIFGFFFTSITRGRLLRLGLISFCYLSAIYLIFFYLSLFFALPSFLSHILSLFSFAFASLAT